MATVSSPPDLVVAIRELVPHFQSALRRPIEQFPVEEFRQLAACGALAVTLPLSEGGLGLGVLPGSHLPLLRLLYELGQANLAVARIFEGHMNALLLIQRYGSAAQVRAAAHDVLEHDCVFGVWNTGWPGQPKLRRLANGGYGLSGGKTFASGAGYIQRAIVTAELAPDHWQMCVVPLSDIEFQIDSSTWNPLGMESSASFTVDFTGVELAEEHLLGGANDYYAEPFFTSGAFRFSAAHLGATHALLDFTCDFLNEANRVHDPHQLARLGKMAIAVETGEHWLAQAAYWLDEGESATTLLPVRAHMMRTASTQLCRDVMTAVEASIGARGLLGSLPFARMLRDLQMYLQQAGADYALTAVGRAATERRKQWQRHFHANTSTTSIASPPTPGTSRAANTNGTSTETHSTP